MRNAVLTMFAFAGAFALVQARAATNPQPAAKPGEFIDYNILVPAEQVATNTAPAPAAAPSATNAVAGTNDPSAVAGLNGYVPDDKYKLRVGDKVSLQIIEDGDAA